MMLQLLVHAMNQVGSPLYLAGATPSGSTAGAASAGISSSELLPNVPLKHVAARLVHAMPHSLAARNLYTLSVFAHATHLHALHGAKSGTARSEYKHATTLLKAQLAAIGSAAASVPGASSSTVIQSPDSARWHLADIAATCSPAVKSALNLALVDCLLALGSSEHLSSAATIVAGELDAPASNSGAIVNSDGAALRWRAAARVSIAMGDTARAITCYQTALHLAPRSGFLWEVRFIAPFANFD